MPNQQKIDLVKNLRDRIKKAKSITVVNYVGLDVNNINDLRSRIKEQKAESLVTKNTLLKLAFEEEGIKDKEIAPHLKGPTAVIFAYEDPISYIKAIYEFAKEFELPKVKFSIIEGIFTAADRVEQISELPTKEQLLAQVVGGIKSPITGLVNVLSGTRNSLVNVLAKVAETKN